ncbi:MAG: hypothetical protein HXS44_02295 [Theionarchaea archaeon]|nr:hypothetical protein [Theionarchaea archaeon]
MDPFTQYRSRGLMVSELAQQLWCEKRVELELLHGKEETGDMKVGRERHEELFKEITPILMVKPETWIDEIFVRCYQMWSLSRRVLNEGIAREIPVYGRIGTMMVKGVIDELLIENGELLVTETKVRASGSVPDYFAYVRVVEFQLSMYRLLLDHIIEERFTYVDMMKCYKIKKDMTISETLYRSFPEKSLFTTSLKVMVVTAFEAVRNLPQPSDTMVVRYENQDKEVIGEREFVFDRKALHRNMGFVMGFWEGKREAVPVTKNMWKCEYCPEVLRHECGVYCREEVSHFTENDNEK